MKTLLGPGGCSRENATIYELPSLLTILISKFLLEKWYANPIAIVVGNILTLIDLSHMIS